MLSEHTAPGGGEGARRAGARGAGCKGWGEPHLQHPHQHVPPVATLLLALGADAVHQVQQELAGHGLDAAGQGLVVDVLGEQLDGEGEVAEGQVLADVVHEVGQRAVGEGPAGRELR